MTTVIATSACSPQWDPKYDGRISLTLERVSDADVTFTLVNGLHHPIAVRGSRTLLRTIRSWPMDTSIRCAADAHSRSESEPIGVADGAPDKFELAYREHVRLVVPSSLPHRFRGGMCDISLFLEHGVVLGPVPFRP